MYKNNLFILSTTVCDINYKRVLCRKKKKVQNLYILQPELVAAHIHGKQIFKCTVTLKKISLICTHIVDHQH